MTVESGRIRKGPSLQSDIMFQMKKGDKVSVIETKGEWHHIQSNNGRTGWAHYSLFSQSDEEPVTIANKVKKPKTVKSSEKKDDIQIASVEKVKKPKTVKSSEKKDDIQIASVEKVKKSKTVKSSEKISDIHENTVSESKKPQPANISAKMNMITDIQVGKISESEEKVIFTLNDNFIPSKTFFLTDDKQQKIVCDFTNTEFADNIHSSINVNGNLIQTIRVGIHENPSPKSRVVMDLVPDKRYELNHISLRNEKRYILIIQAIKNPYGF